VPIDRRTWGKMALAGAVLGIGRLAPAGVGAGVGNRRPDPAEILPLNQVHPQHREAVAEVIRNHSFHRRGAAETFPANPRLYLQLLEEPVLTLALWRDLGDTPAQLQQVGPTRYVGSDGSGTSATWEYLIRTPRLHVLFCDLDYVSPRGAARLEGRLVLIVRSGFFREVNGEFWVQHDVEIFVKVDSRGWKAVAATLRPLIEKVLEDQVQEAGWFVSMMARLVEMYPEWARSVAQQQPQVRPEARAAFTALIDQTRRPGAFAGRPVVADATRPAPGETRRR
jgi:hypothetical protein